MEYDVVFGLPRIEQMSLMIKFAFSAVEMMKYGYEGTLKISRFM